jgi:hypothetical protein
MVGPPRRATHAATAEAGPACARPTPAHEAPAAQPAYWLAQRAAPADLAPRPRTAPRAPPAVGRRRCMLLLLPPHRDPSASGECPHELLIVSGLSPSIDRNQSSLRATTRAVPFSHSARCILLYIMRTPLPRVPPPERVYTYSLEIALRLAHIRKIHLYFSTHRSLSARCDLSRTSRASRTCYIPPRACAATRVSLPTLPVWTACSSSMTTCVPL